MLDVIRPYKLREKMKKLVSVAEPSQQKNPNLFLDRLKEKVRSHQEWEDTEDQPEKNRGSEKHKKNGGQKRSPTDVRGAQPTTGKKPKIDPVRGKNVECYLCGEKGHPLHACPQNPSKERVAQILKERKAAKSKSNKQKEESDYFLVCRFARSEDLSKGRIMAKINEGNYVPAI